MPTKNDRRRLRELLAKNEWEPALELYQQVLTLMETHADVAGQAETLNNIASVHLARQAWAEALEILEPARQLFLEAGDKSEENKADDLP